MGFRIHRMQTRLLWLFLAGVLAPAGANVAEAAPFMIVEESEYDALRALSSSGPWATMKSSAISYMNSHSFNEGDSLESRIDGMRRLMDCGALAYILDPANAVYYLDKMKTALAGWEGLYRDRIDTSFTYYVEGGGAFLCSTLALDVIRDALTAEERAPIEASMTNVADYFYTTARGNWPPNAAAAYGCWATYMGDVARMVESAGEYRDAIETQFNSEGVFTSGPGYAWARYAGDRVTKAYYMDVLDRTGQDSWYDDPRAIGLNEWIFGGAVTPMKRAPSFGDTDIGRWAPWGDPATWRAGRFSELAAANAAWGTTNVTESGLLPYVLMQERPAKEQPKSRIWSSGYAAFWEQNPSYQGTAVYKLLAGYLWTVTHEDNVASGHAHKDINALHLCAYGENVLVNSGYAGYGEGISGSGWTQSYTWDWINGQAESNNTVLVGGKNHSSKLGGGVTEGFTSHGFDYASGNDGPALSTSTHQRNFIQVHPKGGANGYWVLFDEISTSTSYTTAQVLLHPNATTITTTTSNQEYRAAMNGLVYGYGSGVALDVFLATAPTSVAIKKGGVAAFDGRSFEGEYLYSDYALSGSPKKKNVVTILFPEDSTHAKATMARLTGTGITGASIAQGNVVDYAFELDGATTRSYEGVSFRGLATMYRLDEGELDFFFVRQGRSFDDGAMEREGFYSDATVSAFIADTEGSLISSGTNVTFYYHGIIGVNLEESAASIISSGENWVKVAVPSGTWRAEYLLDNYAPVAVDDACGLDEDVPLVVASLGVLANDIDDQTLPQDLTAHGVTAPAHGTLVLGATGGLLYTPDPDYHGTDIFTYRAYDGEFYSEPATVNLDIVSVNDAPVAVEDVYTVIQGEPRVVYNWAGALINDTDADNQDGDPDNDETFTAELASDVAHGVLAFYSNGAFTYVSAASFYGTDSFTYRTSDGEAWSEPARVLLVVQTTSPMPGDANGDGAVDHADATALAQHWGDSGATWAMGDFNRNGVVDAADASILAANWGNHTSEDAGSAVPEPSVIATFVIGLGLFGRRRSRRDRQPLAL